MRTEGDTGRILLGGPPEGGPSDMALHPRRAHQTKSIQRVGAEIWEGDERRKLRFGFSESSGSLNGPDLFTELPFL